MHMTKLKDKTIMDYRDFLEMSMERSNTVHVMQSSFLQDMDMGNMTVEELDEMGHHCHSDFDSQADPDPYFEYNKCHNSSKLDMKLGERRVKY